MNNKEETMKQKIFILIAFLSLCVCHINAQNKIDKLVDNYSAHTTSKYTSAVERNPKTRAIVKVVKVLELNYCNIQPFVNAFREEAKNGDFSEHKTDKDLTMTLTSRGATKNRIYMLKAKDYYANSGYTSRLSNCCITIIVKFK